MDPFEIRNVVPDYPSEQDTPSVEFEYDKINRMVDLFGDVSFEVFFTNSLDSLMEMALENLDVAEIGHRHRAVKGRLGQIKTNHGSLKLIELPELLEENPDHPIKMILAELLTLHTPFAPFLGQNIPANAVKIAMQRLADRAPTLTYRKLFTTSYDSATLRETQVLENAKAKFALLGPKNGRCCGVSHSICQPRNPDDFCSSVNGQCSLASNTNCDPVRK